MYWKNSGDWSARESVMYESSKNTNFMSEFEAFWQKKLAHFIPYLTCRHL